MIRTLITRFPYEAYIGPALARNSICSESFQSVDYRSLYLGTAVEPSEEISSNGREIRADDAELHDDGLLVVQSFRETLKRALSRISRGSNELLQAV